MMLRMLFSFGSAVKLMLLKLVSFGQVQGSVFLNQPLLTAGFWCIITGSLRCCSSQSLSWLQIFSALFSISCAVVEPVKAFNGRTL